MAQPHDRLFQLAFGAPRHAGAWLRRLLPPPLADAIDWTELVAAPAKVHGQQLRLRVPDLLFQAPLVGTTAKVTFVVEHKSHADAQLIAQLLDYAVHLQRGRATPIDGRPPVVAVVLQHGRGKVGPPLPLRGLAPEAAASLAALQPRLAPLIDDLRPATELVLRSRGLPALPTLAMLCLRDLRGASPDVALACLDRWGDLLRAVDRDPGPPPGPDAIAAIGWYGMEVTQVPAAAWHAAFERILTRPETRLMNTIRQLRRHEAAAGRAKGLAEGRRAVLEAILAQRFGPLPEAARQRLHAADVPTLDRWAAAALQAPSLEALFATPA